MGSIDAKHPEYERQEKRWRTVRDSIAGEDAVKARGEEYLPEPPAIAGLGVEWSTTSRSTRRSAYDWYMTFAEFPEIVSLAIDGYQGIIHSKDPQVILPTALEHLIESATPTGESLQTLWTRITRGILEMGRVCILIDPRDGVDGELSLAMYEAPALTNWRELNPAEGGGIVHAAMFETQASHKDAFEVETVETILELLLLSEEEGGQPAYWSRRWRKVAGQGSTDTPQWVPGPWSRVTVRGQTLDEIPLTVINAQWNGTRYGMIPAYPLSKRAMAIYRKTADYNRSIYTKSDPQIWIRGVLDKSEIPTTIGGSGIWSFKSENAHAEYLDIDGQGIPLQREAIDHEYERFYQEGGKLMDSGQAGRGESGSMMRRRHNINTVTLKSMTVHAGRTLEGVLRRAAELVGADPDEVRFAPDLDFAEPTLEPKDVLTLVETHNRGGPVAHETIHAFMHRGGLTELSFEEESALADAQRQADAGFLGRDDTQGGATEGDGDGGSADG